ncbi:cadherin-19-like isoform X2 [Hemicordylus capensis]|uniref:cadherin-19-like isoform X2 n=1 Tax=Hemicordylus capensis TaxID=884348 RepID=UPI0023038C91|nr:cadherin-19-like isoform X2 [Hemicordylus capensis]
MLGMHCYKWLSLALIQAQLGACLPCMHNCNSDELDQTFVRPQRVKRGWMRSLLVVQEELMLTHLLTFGQPRFLDGPYEATVPEMSEEGTSVIQVTATDPSSARLFYSILEDQPYFFVEPTTGVIRTSSPVDRETKDKFFVVLQASDMIDQMGGRSGTTTVTINISDVNDNSPIFQEERYDMHVSEAASVGTIIGKIKADDSDIGKNAEMDYMIIKDEFHILRIITNNETQEGTVILNKRLDYEKKHRHDIIVKVVNRYIDVRFQKNESFGDTTVLRIIVKDADEPPVFSSVNYIMDISEGERNGSLLGVVSAKDPDVASSPIRYSIVHSNYLKRLFSINAHNGTIIITKPLDREIAAWHNITVTATESRNPKQISQVIVYIQVLDVNEYAPEFPKYYETYVCENARSGQLIQTISATDKDDPMENHHFSFSLADEATNNSSFEVRDNLDNTAGIVTIRSGFHRREQFIFALPISIADNGVPSLTSTTTLTITVCDCDTKANLQVCRYGAFFFSMGISVQALVAVVACMLIISAEARR